MRAIYVDIETIGNPTAVALLGPVKAAGNLKDPAKIAADIADKEAKRVERAALDCDTAQIVCIGYLESGVDDANVQTLTGNEATMLNDFWEVVDYNRGEDPRCVLVGFNCLGYDLPVLIRRSQVLRVPVPPLSLAKYRHDGIVDLMSVLTWDGLVDAKSLSVYCRLAGLDVPDDEATGADVARLYARGPDGLGQIAAHCVIDVIKTRALYEWVFYPGLRSA